MRDGYPVSATLAGNGAPPATPSSVLVVVTRRLGDVLLALPLIRSIKAAWPEATVDALVFDGTKDVLAGHPDLRRVVAVAERPGVVNHARFILSLVRRYDIALSCLEGDRPTLYAALAGRWRAGLVPRGKGSSWKRWLLSRAVVADNLDTHTVAMNLALADAHGNRAAPARSTSGGPPKTRRTSHRVCPASRRRVPTPRCTSIRNSTTRCGTSRAGSGSRNGCESREIASVLTGGSEPSRSRLRDGGRRADARRNDQSRGRAQPAAVRVRHRRGAAVRRPRHCDDAHGGCARRSHGRVVRPLQSREVGALAQGFLGHDVTVAARGHPVDRQRRARAGCGRVRSVHARRLRPARRELFGLPARSCRCRR